MPTHSESELQEINERFEQILAACPDCSDPKREAKIRKAYKFALMAHAGKMHRSGELYIHHLLSVAEIAIKELKLGPKSVMAALLHHIIEDTDFGEEDIRKQFGDKVAYLASSLTKIVNARQWYQTDEAENFKRLLLTISEDLRVLLLRFADRLHVLRTLRNEDKNYRLKIANESIQVYAPLAHRLGLYSVKKELENLGFKHQRPHAYRVLFDAVQGNEEKRTKFINNFSLRIIGDLTREEIDFKIVGRPKTIYSIWNKMKNKGVSFKEVYDLSAIRIIFKPKPGVPELTQCWKIYEVVSKRYTPIPDRLRDWVSVPKTTGYEALHTTLSVGKRFVEVQIRSERMHEIAELGLAAHWKYKNVNSKKEKFDQQIREIQNFLKDPAVDKVELLDDIKLNLLSSDILVFTPQNEIKTLPKYSTVLDFAYSIHTDLAHKCIGAKINKESVPITHQITNGDKVEILTSHSQKPKAQWHDFVVTAKAKTDLKRLFRDEFDRFHNEGKIILERILADLGTKMNSNVFQKIRKYHQVRDYADLCLKIGEQKITESHLRKIFKIRTRFRHVRFWSVRLDLPETFTPEQSKRLGKLASEQEMGLFFGAANPHKKFIISPCCVPKPGDKIAALLNNDGQCVVHKRECTSVAFTTEDQLLFDAEWRRHKIRAEMTRIRVIGQERYGQLSSLTRLLDEDYSIVVHSMYFKAENGILKSYFDVLAPDITVLNSLITKLASLKELERVEYVDSSAIND